MFTSREECETRKYVNSNPRYKNFCQTYFTAGDEEQFETNRTHQDLSNITPKYTQIPHIHISDLHHNITADTAIKTFRYIFDKFKKGIYISIRDNKLATFLPFSKAKFVNEWSGQIKIDPTFRTMTDFAMHIASLENRPFYDNYVNSFVNHWYGNNCLVRYEYPLRENDTGVHHIKSMFEELCEHEIVPDIDFFVNRRDFPILKLDRTEPYNHMWDSDSKPLISHSYEKYAPVLSSTSASNFADIPIPTLDDWARIKYAEGVFFPKTHRRTYDEISQVTDETWNAKRECAVFRGASTGVGTTIDTNTRLKVAYFSSLNKRDIDGELFLDAGITDWNIRPRKIQGERYLKTIEINELPFKLVPKLTHEEQSKYKYIVHIDGHVSAFRLSVELGMGSVILKVDSEYKLWYSDMLIPYVHYVPVSKDLVDIYYKIQWCKENDDVCLEIVRNAKKLYDTYLCKKGVLSHLKNVLCMLKDKIGVRYHYTEHPLDIQIREQMLSIKRIQSPECTVQIANTILSKIGKSPIGRFKSGVVVKQTTDPKKTNENIHEAFIGVNVINGLADSMPNFIHIEGIDSYNSVVSEYVDGISFYEWIKGANFRFDEFVDILQQLSLALHQAQLRCGFVHNDLFPWNIMLKRYDKPMKTTYIVSSDVVVTVESRVVPVMIDYGKSHVVYKGKHYGFINMYKFNSIIDVLSVLFSSVAARLKAYRVDKGEGMNFVSILNFIEKTGMYKGSFKTLQDVKQFVVDNSSFSYLITLDTAQALRPIGNTKESVSSIGKRVSHFGMSSSMPFDFCMFLHEKFKTKIVVDNKIIFPIKKYKPKKITSKLNSTLAVYYLFQQLSNDALLPEFQAMLASASFKELKRSDLSKSIDDFDYLNPDIDIPIPIIGDEIMVYSVLLYRGPFELSVIHREYLEHTPLGC